MKRSSFLFIALSALALVLPLIGAAVIYSLDLQRSQTEILFTPYLIGAVFCFLLLFCALLFFTALASLRQRRISESERLVWVLIMLFFPFIGPIAFFLVSPGRHAHTVA